MEREENSGGLWHRSHLHSSAGSRWTDERIDGQTEQREGETHKILAGTAAPPPAHKVLLQKEGGRCQKMNNRQTTSNSAM